MIITSYPDLMTLDAFLLHSLQMGHYTFECKNEPVYQSRPSRTQQLKNPKVCAAL